MLVQTPARPLLPCTSRGSCASRAVMRGIEPQSTLGLRQWCVAPTLSYRHTSFSAAVWRCGRSRPAPSSRPSAQGHALNQDDGSDLSSHRCYCRGTPGPIFPSLLLPRDPTGARLAVKVENCKRRILRRAEDSGEKKKNRHAREVEKHWTQGNKGAPTEQTWTPENHLQQTRRLPSVETRAPPLHTNGGAHLCTRH